jgi:hypothetical protein
MFPLHQTVVGFRSRKSAREGSATGSPEGSHLKTERMTGLAHANAMVRINKPVSENRKVLSEILPLSNSDPQYRCEL